MIERSNTNFLISYMLKRFSTLGHDFFLRYYLNGIKATREVLNKFLPTARILLYHRVDSTENDPHLLCVSTKNFYDQIKYVKEKYRVVGLKDLVEELQSGAIVQNTVSITFDDGYADNYYNALPILEKLKVPATFFISTDYIGKRKPFFWDIGVSNKDRGRPLTRNELRGLSKSKFAEIGAHTISHLHLSQQKLGIQENEIVESKLFLEDVVRKSVDGFSYPFGGKGDFSRQTVFLVKKAGYRYGVSAFAGRVYLFSSLYTLPRYVVRDWTIRDFQIKMNGFI